MKNTLGKVALVTGGSRGIGAGIVRELAATGVQVAFTYLRADQQAQALVVAIEQAGGTALAIRADTTEAAGIEHALQTVLARFGQLDILVNNAGVSVISPLEAGAPDEEALANLWRVNAWGPAHTVRAAVAHLSAGGRIITIGSVANIRTPFVGLSDYAATKGALAAYTRGWARELAPRRITVNIIQPGLIDTEALPTDEATVAALLAPVALGRFGTTSEIGQVVAFLASDAAGYITGATLNVDGGWSI